MAESAPNEQSAGITSEGTQTDERTMRSLEADTRERLDTLAERAVDWAAIRLPSGATPRTWRQLLHFAKSQLYPNGEYSDAEYLMRFEMLHGQCSIGTMLELAMLYTSIRFDPSPPPPEDVPDLGRDMLFVLYMLGVWPEHPLAPQARSVLVDYLSSPHRTERWASAISLSHLRDERAIPMLLTMLTEELPQPEPWDVESEAQARDRWKQFDYAAVHAQMLERTQVPHILWRWGVRSAIPALRHTLELTARIERTEAHWDPDRRWAQYWQGYQFDLLYALARLGAFGALVGIEPPDDDVRGPRSGRIPGPTREGTAPGIVPPDQRSNRWRVRMCLAAVAQRFEEAGRHGSIQAAEVRLEVERLLAEQFGLDEEARHVALALFYDYQLQLELD